MALLNRRAVTLFAALVLAMPGCIDVDFTKLAESIETFADQVERGAITAENFPTQAKIVLDHATGDQREILRSLLKQTENTLNRTTQNIGVEGRFTLQFARDQVVYDLRCLAASLTGDPLPAPVPKIATPSATTLIRGNIGTELALDLVVTGSNLHATDIGAVAVAASGAEIPLRFSMQTPLMAVIPFTGDNLKDVGSWKAVTIKKGTGSLMSVAVADPPPRKVETVIKTATLTTPRTTLTVWPVYVPSRDKKGKPAYNNEFGGKGGPSMDVTVTFRLDPNDARKLQANLHVTAWESHGDHKPRGDGTRGSGSSGWQTIYTAVEGHTITKFDSKPFSGRFRDNRGTEKQTENVTHPLIDKLIIMGDTDTDQDMSTNQAGAEKTHVQVFFKPFAVDVQYSVPK